MADRGLTQRRPCSAVIGAIYPDRKRHARFTQSVGDVHHVLQLGLGLTRIFDPRREDGVSYADMGMDNRDALTEA